MSLCAYRPRRPQGSGEVWSLRASFKLQGALPFLESRKLTFEEAQWVRFLSFPPLTPFLVGVQECGRGSSSVASC